MRKRTKEFYERMNGVADKIALTKLSPNEHKYCWIVFRKTFMHGKCRDYISRSQMAKLTGMAETTASDVKKRLVERNIIKQSGKITGFNIDTGQWEKVKVSLPFGKVKVSLQKGQGIITKRSRYHNTTKKLSKETTQRREDFYKMLSRTEIEKLESDQWYQAVMWNYGKFGMEYIEKTMKDYDYDTRMSCWYIYADSGNIRNKEAFFSHLLRNYKEDLEK